MPPPISLRLLGITLLVCFTIPDLIAAAFHNFTKTYAGDDGPCFSNSTYSCPAAVPNSMAPNCAKGDDGCYRTACISDFFEFSVENSEYSGITRRYLNFSRDHRQEIEAYRDRGGEVAYMARYFIQAGFPECGLSFGGCKDTPDCQELMSGFEGDAVRARDALFMYKSLEHANLFLAAYLNAMQKAADFVRSLTSLAQKVFMQQKDPAADNKCAQIRMMMALGVDIAMTGLTLAGGATMEFAAAGAFGAMSESIVKSAQTAAKAADKAGGWSQFGKKAFKSTLTTMGGQVTGAAKMQLLAKQNHVKVPGPNNRSYVPVPELLGQGGLEAALKFSGFQLPYASGMCAGGTGDFPGDPFGEEIDIILELNKLLDSYEDTIMGVSHNYNIGTFSKPDQPSDLARFIDLGWAMGDEMAEWLRNPASLYEYVKGRFVKVLATIGAIGGQCYQVCSDMETVEAAQKRFDDVKDKENIGQMRVVHGKTVCQMECLTSSTKPTIRAPWFLGKIASYPWNMNLTEEMLGNLEHFRQYGNVRRLGIRSLGDGDEDIEVDRHNQDFLPPICASWAGYNSINDNMGGHAWSLASCGNWSSEATLEFNDYIGWNFTKMKTTMEKVWRDYLPHAFSDHPKAPLNTFMEPCGWRVQLITESQPPAIYPPGIFQPIPRYKLGNETACNGLRETIDKWFKNDEIAANVWFCKYRVTLLAYNGTLPRGNATEEYSDNDYDCKQFLAEHPNVAIPLGAMGS